MHTRAHRTAPRQRPDPALTLMDIKSFGFLQCRAHLPRTISHWHLQLRRRSGTLYSYLLPETAPGALSVRGRAAQGSLHALVTHTLSYILLDLFFC